MNFLIKGTGLIAALFLFFSCDDPNDVGLGVPQDARHIDTITINASTIQLSKDVTSHDRDVILAGRIKEPGTGTFSSSAFSQFLPQDEPAEGSGIVTDSVKLFLDCNYTYGDISKPLTLHFYQLSQGLSSDEYTLNSSAAETMTPELASKTFSFSSEVSDFVVDLPNSFGDEILAAPHDQEQFVEQIKGLAIIPDSESDAAVYGFNTLSADSRIEVYYHTSDSEELTYSIYLSEGAERYYTVSTSGDTRVSDMTDLYDTISASNSANTAYIMGGEMLGLYINFPYLDELRRDEDRVIVKAELIVPVEEEEHANAVTHVSLYSADNTPSPEERILNQSTGEYRFEYSGEGYYSIPLTNYFTEIYYSETHAPGIIIAPSPQLSDFLISRSSLPVRNPDGPLRLKLYYSY